MQLENNRFLRVDGVVLLADLDKSTISRVTRNYLEKREKSGQLAVASAALPKSFIVYDDGKKEQTVLSVFSPEVLAKRANS